MMYKGKYLNLDGLDLESVFFIGSLCYFFKCDI